MLAYFVVENSQNYAYFKLVIFSFQNDKKYDQFRIFQQTCAGKMVTLYHCMERIF